jgi:hypothetical protein
MPNIRRLVIPGDHIFVISGRVAGLQQLIMGGFEVAEKLATMMMAYERLPALRLHRSNDGDVQGNIIINSRGRQHTLDTHDPTTFKNRIKDYVIGRDTVALTEPHEIIRGRAETMDVLREVLRKSGSTPIQVVGRWAKLEERQALAIRDWLFTVKAGR